MRIIICLLIFIQSLSAFAKNVSGELKLLSDYIVRGQTRTDKGPSIQGQLKYVFPFNIYIGIGASNIGADETRAVEGKIHLGSQYSLSENIRIKIEAQYYDYLMILFY